jgi:hypothetical protein
MRVIGRLLVLLLGGLIAAAIAGTIAARQAQRRIVPIDDPEADEIRLAAIFAPVSFKSTAASFRGGSVDCWYGGGVIDLRGATLDPAGARLDVKAVFGGAQILVPESWRVTARVLGIGGIGDARPGIERAEDAPHLTIEGTAIFGGFGVAYEMPEEATRGLEEAVAKAAAKASARHEHAETPLAAGQEPASAESPEVVSAG